MTINGQTLPQGYQLHWYKIESVLGQGAFGITYLAFDTNLNHHVAIKEFFLSDVAKRAIDNSVQHSSDSTDLFEWGLSRFITEARTLAQCDHPNLISVHTVFEANRTAYIVMDYVKGQNLKEKINAGLQKSEADLKNLLFPLMSGLSKVHELGFIHRDIKPGNILLRNDGSPVLADFGSSRKPAYEMTILISKGYAPFEQYSDCHDTNEQGPWTDIYALGATMYECITGKKPIDALDRMHIKIKEGRDPLILLGEIAQGQYSDDFLMAIDFALALEPEERPQSVDQWMHLFSGKERTHKMQTIHPPQFQKHETITEDTEGSLTTSILPVAGRPNGAVPWKKSMGWKSLLSLLLLVSVVFLMYIKNDFEQASPSVTINPTTGHLDELKANNRKQQRIRQLLAAAEQDIQASRFSTPVGNNAAEKFQTVLELDSNHKGAQQDLQRIADGYVEIAEHALVGKRFAETESYLEKAETIFPGTKKIEDIRKRLSYAKTQGLEEKAAAKTKQEKIRQLLTAADQDIQAFRLSTPSGNNAREKYQMVLKLEPRHRSAQEGLERISNRYARMAEMALLRKQFSKTESYLKKAETIFPGTGNIQGIREHLNKAKIEDIEKKSAVKKKQERIRQLLAAAEQNIQASRLSVPAGDNAKEKFRMVLELEPGHEDAKRGLGRIVNLYVKMAEKALSKNRFPETASHLEQAESTLFGTAAVQDVRERLDEAKLRGLAATKKQQRIRQLLAAAEQDIQASRLSTPTGNNAQNHFRVILTLAPDNAKATLGLERIDLFQQYINSARIALLNKKYDLAHEHLSQADKVFPNLEIVRQHRKLLYKARQGSARRRSLPPP